MVNEVPVATGASFTFTTVMPTFGAIICNSMNIDSDSATTPCFATLYGAMNGGDVRPAMDAVFTI